MEVLEPLDKVNLKLFKNQFSLRTVTEEFQIQSEILEIQPINES